MVADQKERVIVIRAKVVGQGRYVTFQMAEVAVPRRMFADILPLIARCWHHPRPHEGTNGIDVASDHCGGAP